MVTFREFVNAFRELRLDHRQIVIVHASLSTVGEIRGGPETVLGALLTVAQGVIAPAFTYKTMIIPQTGPGENACAYGTGKDHNALAEYFLPDMPADSTMGILAETIRTHPEAARSSHPILSFTGINAPEVLAAQTIEDPLAPIRVLSEKFGTVLLIGVNHTVNTSIHYAEKLAGRKQFIRWALTPQGICECPGFGGCSDGFEQAVTYLEPITRTAMVGNAVLRTLPIEPMIRIVTNLIKEQPLALLCDKGDERCAVVRQDVLRQMAENREGGASQ
jgi:aminoglycoside 3-N-acetyltransferase